MLDSISPPARPSVAELVAALRQSQDAGGPGSDGDGRDFRRELFSRRSTARGEGTGATAGHAAAGPVLNLPGVGVYANPRAAAMRTAAGYAVREEPHWYGRLDVTA